MYILHLDFAALKIHNWYLKLATSIGQYYGIKRTMLCIKLFFIFPVSFLVFFVKTIRFYSVELMDPQVFSSLSRRGVPLGVEFYDLESKIIKRMFRWTKMSCERTVFVGFVRWTMVIEPNIKFVHCFSHIPNATSVTC